MSTNRASRPKRPHRAGPRGNQRAVQRADAVGRHAVGQRRKRRRARRSARRRNATWGPAIRAAQSRSPRLAGSPRRRHTARAPDSGITAIVTSASDAACSAAIAARSTSVRVSPLTSHSRSSGTSENARRGPPPDPSSGHFPRVADAERPVPSRRRRCRRWSRAGSGGSEGRGECPGGTGLRGCARPASAPPPAAPALRGRRSAGAAGCRVRR